MHLDKISWSTFLWSTLAAAVGTWLTMIGWRTLLRDLGSDLHLAPASGVYFVGQLGKYLPGSLWSVLVQADIASHLKVPRRRTAVTGLLALGLALLTGLLVGLPGGVLPPHAARRPASTGGCCSASRSSSCCACRGCSTPSSTGCCAR